MAIVPGWLHQVVNPRQTQSEIDSAAMFCARIAERILVPGMKLAEEEDERRRREFNEVFGLDRPPREW